MGYEHSLQFIVFDLEWNMPYRFDPLYERYKNDLPEELIELGAVKLDADGHVLDTFHTYIKPHVYPKLHSRVKRLTGLTMDHLQTSGVSFQAAFESFAEWCGSNPLLCSWSQSDIFPLKHSLTHYQLLDACPSAYLDLQYLFHRVCPDTNEQAGLLTACAYFGIEADQTVHHALSDAQYAAIVLQKMLSHMRAQSMKINEILKGFIWHFTWNFTSEKMLNLPQLRCSTMELWRQVTDQLVLHCPHCGRVVLMKKPWTARNHYKWTAVAECPDHGIILAKLTPYHPRVGESTKQRRLILKLQLQKYPTQ